MPSFPFVSKKINRKTTFIYAKLNIGKCNVIARYWHQDQVDAFYPA